MENREKNKTADYKRYDELSQLLNDKKKVLKVKDQDFISMKEQMKKDDIKEKTTEFRKAEKEIKDLKQEINLITREWRKSDPNKLHFDRDEFREHCVRRFFFVPSFEIYGGVSGLYDFGPALCAIKANVINLWRNHFILEENMLELDCSVLTPYSVFKASGHVDRFADYMVKDLKTSEYYRADKILKAFIEDELTKPTLTEEKIQEYSQVLREIDNYDADMLSSILKKLKVKSAIGNELSDPIPFNLMFTTQIGPTGKSAGYLRPETAQGLFLNFKRCLDYNGGQVPFAAATVGQAFRNEISPRGDLLRVREFTLAEIEHFVHPDEKVHPKFDTVKDIKLPLLSRENQLDGKPAAKISMKEAVEKGMICNETLAYFMARTYTFMQTCGILEKGIQFRQHMANEMAHYSTDCWDCEILTTYGWVEVVGHADRSCFDLTAHQKETNTDLVAFKTYDTPKEYEVVEVEENKKLFGKTLRKDAKPALSYLQGLKDEEKMKLKEQLEKDGKITISIEGNDNLELDKNLIEIKKVQKVQAGESFVPSVIEPSFGIGRLLYCIMEHSYWVREDEEEQKKKEAEKQSKKKKKKEAKVSRVVFSFTPTIAPYKVILLPLQQNKEFNPFIDGLSKKLVSNGISYRVDTSGQAIGRRYARADDVGIPFAITIDFDSLSGDTVTLRERDSCQQIRAKTDEVISVVNDLVKGKLSWEKVRELFPEQKESASSKVGKV